MRLSGIVFIIVGTVVALVSFFLLGSGQKMALFMYAGIALAVFGAIRWYIDREEKPTSEQDRRAQLAAQLPTGQRSFTEIPRVCGVCQTKNNPKANFCGHCGNKL